MSLIIQSEFLNENKPAVNNLTAGLYLKRKTDWICSSPCVIYRVLVFFFWRLIRLHLSNDSQDRVDLRR
jgi:hypothetical protein